MKKGPWIEVYPIERREVKVVDSGARVSLNQELQEFVDQEWRPKAEKGWTSSWVALAHEASFTDTRVDIKSGAMQFHQIDGMDKAIEAGKSFAPEQGYVNCLSVGFITATADGSLIFQRREPDVHVPNTLIQEPCGYMASMMIASRSECADPKYASDPRLFDVKVQLDARQTQIAEAFKLGPEDVGYDPEDVGYQVSYDIIQDALGAGSLTTEMYLSTTGKIDARKEDLSRVAKIKRPGVELAFLNLEDVKPLILNQGKLATINPRGYRPDDVRQMPLIDESIVGLIWGYEKLTEEKLDIDEIVDRLNRDGLNIRVYDTKRATYQFQTTF